MQVMQVMRPFIFAEAPLREKLPHPLDLATWRQKLEAAFAEEEKVEAAFAEEEQVEGAYGFHEKIWCLRRLQGHWRHVARSSRCGSFFRRGVSAKINGCITCITCIT